MAADQTEGDNCYIKERERGEENQSDEYSSSHEDLSVCFPLSVVCVWATRLLLHCTTKHNKWAFAAVGQVGR